jgi:hypothetical protein
MDQLAKDGMLFRRAYTTVPSCIPARYAMLTGLFPQTSGVVGYQMKKPMGNPTMPQVLRGAGYRTALVGRNMHQSVGANALIAGLWAAGLSTEGLLGDSLAISRACVRKEPCAAQKFFDRLPLFNPWRGMVKSFKTRSAPRRMACPIGGRLSPDFRARRRALAIDECSDEDDRRLTIRNSRGQSQCVSFSFHPFPENVP